MSFLLLFQECEEVIPDQPMSVDLGTTLIPSCSIDLDAELSFMEIDVEHGTVASAEFFPNVVDLLLSSGSRSRLSFFEESLVSLSVRSVPFVSMEFSTATDCSISSSSGSFIVVRFAEDGGVRFFDISASATPRAGISFADTKLPREIVTHTKDAELRYLEFVV